MKKKENADLLKTVQYFGASAQCFKGFVKLFIKRKQHGIVSMAALTTQEQPST